MKGPGLMNPVLAPIVNTPPPERSPDQAPVPELERQKPPEVQVAVLDLRKRGITRGENSTKPGGLESAEGPAEAVYLSSLWK